MAFFCQTNDQQKKMAWRSDILRWRFVCLKNYQTNPARRSDILKCFFFCPNNYQKCAKRPKMTKMLKMHPFHSIPFHSNRAHMGPCGDHGLIRPMGPWPPIEAKDNLYCRHPTGHWAWPCRSLGSPGATIHQLGCTPRNGKATTNPNHRTSKKAVVSDC